MDTIQRFEGHYFFLSNFYPCEIKWKKVKFPTVEHAFQASKTKDLNLRREIAALPTPNEAKKAGRKLQLRSDWEEIKIDVMRKLLYIKFRQDDFLAGLLCGTGYAELIEGNWWGDKFWGVCEGKGQNELGKLLMELRRELQAEYLEL